MHIYNNDQGNAQKEKALSFFMIAGAFQAMGGLIGFITSKGVGDWYQSLERSPFNPPDWAFGVAWTILYFLLSVSFWLVWESKDHPHRKMILTAFSGHMVLNWAWSPLFFIAHVLLPSYILILVLIFTAAMLAYLIWPLNRIAAVLFAPYIGWLILAGHLSEFIWRNN